MVGTEWVWNGWPGIPADQEMKDLLHIVLIQYEDELDQLPVTFNVSPANKLWSHRVVLHEWIKILSWCLAMPSLYYKHTLVSLKHQVYCTIKGPKPQIVQHKAALLCIIRASSTLDEFYKAPLMSFTSLWVQKAVTPSDAGGSCCITIFSSWISNISPIPVFWHTTDLNLVPNGFGFQRI